MADSQVENFTAPQTSSALNTANQQSEGAMWPGPSNDVPAHASLPHLPLPLPLLFLLQALTLLLPEIPDASVSHPLLLSTPPWKEKPSHGGPRRCLDVWVPQRWLIVGGWPRLAFIFWLRAQLTGLWPLIILCVYIVPFFSGTVSTLQEWSYWSSQQPSEVWKWQKVLAPSFLQRVKSSCLFWGCVANLHLSFNFIGGRGQRRGVGEAGLALLLCLLGQELTYWISFLQKSTGKWSPVNDQLV